MLLKIEDFKKETESGIKALISMYEGRIKIQEKRI